MENSAIIKGVLCIGHNTGMNHLLQTILSGSYKMYMSGDIFHAMKSLKHNENISLIIIDIDYQTKESLDFIIHINESRLFKKPVIALSSSDDLNFPFNRNVYAFFKKPFNPADLVSSVNELNRPKAISIN